MSISFKVVLDQRRKSSTGKFPLRLRVYQNGKYKETSLKINITSESWDESKQTVLRSEKSYKLYNSKLLSISTSIQKYILLSEVTSDNSITIEDVIAKAQNQPANKKKVSTCFIEYGEKLALDLKQSGRVGNSIVYKCAINKLKTFWEKSSLPINNFNYKLLTDFNNYMLKEGLKINAISNYMRTIRAIYNRAIKDGLISQNEYPFSMFKIKNERTASRALTLDEMRRFVMLDIANGSSTQYWRDLFLLSFYLIGINYADMFTLKYDNVVNGRVVFRRLKTGKIYSIKLHEHAELIINRYRHTNTFKNDFLLPTIKQVDDLIKLKADINQARKISNKHLTMVAGKCNIDKKITTYYARYTWANIARQLGYSKDMIAEALGHEYGNRVTSIYLDSYDAKMIDDMNNAVIKVVNR